MSLAVQGLLVLVVNAASALVFVKLLPLRPPYSRGRVLLRGVFVAIAYLAIWGIVTFAAILVFGTAWLRNLK